MPNQATKVKPVPPEQLSSISKVPEEAPQTIDQLLHEPTYTDDRIWYWTTYTCTDPETLNTLETPIYDEKAKLSAQEKQDLTTSDKQPQMFLCRSHWDNS